MLLIAVCVHTPSSVVSSQPLVVEFILEFALPLLESGDLFLREFDVLAVFHLVKSRVERRRVHVII